MVIVSFSISSVCILVILLIFWVTPVLGSATAHSPSGKMLNPLTLPLRRCPFFRALYLGIKISLYPASSLFGTQQQLTHPPVKSSTLPFRKMPVYSVVTPWHTNFTLSCIIPRWDSATAHSPSCKELIPSSLKESCFPGFIFV